MNKVDLENLELKILINAIYEAYGVDFQDYALASFRRRIDLFVKKNKYESITHLLADVLHKEESLSVLINSISVTTSEMFRNPSVFAYFRKEVIPYLKTFPHIRIWHAACANGEEVYSLAILLKEEGIYDRCSIYATDINQDALNNIQKGIFPLKMMKEYSGNYQKSNGLYSLSEYYHAKYNSVIFNKDLIKNVTFSTHNLTTDSVFMETQFILCRNVLIYFNNKLQNRVFNLFNESLVNGGILCLGNKETMQFSPIIHNYKLLNKESKIYRKEQTSYDKV